MLLQAQQALDRLLLRFLSTATDAGVFVAAFLVIYLPGRFVLVPVVGRLLAYGGVEETFKLSAEKVFHASLGLFAAIVAVTVSGLSTYLTATAAITAAATIALGFAAQDVLGNFVSGVFIVLDPEFHVGDWIQWNDREGIIEDISFRVTRIHTFDNELITVPNAELTKHAVVSPVAKDRLRIRTTFAVSYEDDIDRARAVLLDEAREHADIVDRPGPSVRLLALADSAVELEVRYWIDSPARTDFVRIRSEYAQRVKERFDRDGIEMPYPTVHVTGELDTPRSASDRQ